MGQAWAVTGSAWTVMGPQQGQSGTKKLKFSFLVPWGGGIFASIWKNSDEIRGIFPSKSGGNEVCHQLEFPSPVSARFSPKLVDILSANLPALKVHWEQNFIFRLLPPQKCDHFSENPILGPAFLEAYPGGVCLIFKKKLCPPERNPADTVFRNFINI